MKLITPSSWKTYIRFRWRFWKGYQTSIFWPEFSSYIFGGGGGCGYIRNIFSGFRRNRFKL